MLGDWDIHVETRGGVETLSRVVGVLALLELTPLGLRSESSGDGLQIRLRLTCLQRDHALCVARMGALVCVRAIESTVVCDRRKEAQPCAAASL
jgi:hypothetical protein